MARFRPVDHFLEVLTRRFDGHTAEAVVSAKFKNHQRGMLGNYVVDSSQPIRGRISADSLIVDVIAIAMLIEQILKIVGITSARYSRRQAVAKRHDKGAVNCR